MKKVVRESRGAKNNQEMRQVYTKLKKRGLNPFVLKCRKCRSWLFVFSRNVRPQDYALVFKEYVDMLLNDYGSKITCPDCGCSNLALIIEFKAKFWGLMV